MRGSRSRDHFIKSPSTDKYTTLDKTMMMKFLVLGLALVGLARAHSGLVRTITGPNSYRFEPRDTSPSTTALPTEAIEVDKQGGTTGVGNSPDQQSGCATPEGRAGQCTVSVVCNTVANQEVSKCESPTPSNFFPVICCPRTSDLGVYPNDTAGCGVKATSSPIVGGGEAQPNAWPWQVALFQKSARNSNEASFICGGSIINKRFVMTAAHCVVRMEGRLRAQDFLVLVGAHNVKTDGTFYNVSKVLAHENYRAHRRYNDITLFRLNEDIDFNNPTARPVCLPTGEMDANEYVGEKTTVTGWGTTSFGGDVSPTLREVEVPVVSADDCNAAYKSVEGSAVSYPDGINHTMICAGDLEKGGADSCQGDSGGPLVWKSPDGRYIQFGVVSFGYKCAEPKYPGVYTRVSAFLKWIGSHIEENWY